MHLHVINYLRALVGIARKKPKDEEVPRPHISSPRLLHASSMPDLVLSSVQSPAMTSSPGPTPPAPIPIPTAHAPYLKLRRSSAAASAKLDDELRALLDDGVEEIVWMTRPHEQARATKTKRYQGSQLSVVFE